MDSSEFSLIVRQSLGVTILVLHGALIAIVGSGRLPLSVEIGEKLRTQEFDTNATRIDEKRVRHKTLEASGKESQSSKTLRFTDRPGESAPRANRVERQTPSHTYERKDWEAIDTHVAEVVILLFSFIVTSGPHGGQHQNRGGGRGYRGQFMQWTSGCTPSELGLHKAGPANQSRPYGLYNI